MALPGTDKAIANLAAWGRREDWRDALDEIVARHFGPIGNATGLEIEDIAEQLGKVPFAILMGCVYEDFFTTEFGPDGDNVIDDYLKRRGWRETVPGRRYLEALRRSVMSVYEVVGIEPGRGMTLKDLFRGGAPVTVEEKSGSKSAVPWDRLACRVLEIKDRFYLSGGLLHLTPELAGRILDTLALAMKEEERPPGQTEAAARDQILAWSVPLMTAGWLAATIEGMARPMPRMQNMEGHAIAFTTVRFPIAEGGAEEITRRLDHINVFGRPTGASEPAWTWYQWLDAEGNPVVIAAGEGVPDEYRRAGRNRILGKLRIVDGTLLVEVNSYERAQRIQDLLVDLLGTFVGRPLSTVQSFEQAMAEHGNGTAPSQEEEIPPEVKTRIIHQFLDDHYRRTIEEPIPMLGNKSPRQLVRTGKDRAKVAEWLKQAESSEARRAQVDGTDPYDLTWAWRDLGILDLRK